MQQTQITTIFLKSPYSEIVKRSLIIVLILMSLSACNSPQLQDSKEDKHIEVNFNIDQKKNGEASLTFDIVIDSGYYFVSPHSDGFHQRLIFSIERSDSLLLNNELIEFPMTLETYDKLSDKNGRFVRENTRYHQDLVINSENDFEVKGLIWLEMLPNSSPYEIKFSISNMSGKLSVEESSISPSGYPTFWDKKRLDITSDQHDFY